MLPFMWLLVSLATLALAADLSHAPKKQQSLQGLGLSQKGKKSTYMLPSDGVALEITHFSFSIELNALVKELQQAIAKSQAGNTHVEPLRKTINIDYTTTPPSEQSIVSLDTIRSLLTYVRSYASTLTNVGDRLMNLLNYATSVVGSVRTG